MCDFDDAALAAVVRRLVALEDGVAALEAELGASEPGAALTWATVVLGHTGQLDALAARVEAMEAAVRAAAEFIGQDAETAILAALDAAPDAGLDGLRAGKAVPTWAGADTALVTARIVDGEPSIDVRPIARTEPDPLPGPVAAVLDHLADEIGEGGDRASSLYDALAAILATLDDAPDVGLARPQSVEATSFETGEPAATMLEAAVALDVCATIMRDMNAYLSSYVAGGWTHNAKPVGAWAGDAMYLAARLRAAAQPAPLPPAPGVHDVDDYYRDEPAPLPGPVADAEIVRIAERMIRRDGDRLAGAGKSREEHDTVADALAAWATELAERDRRLAAVLTSVSDDLEFLAIHYAHQPGSPRLLAVDSLRAAASELGGGEVRT